VACATTWISRAKDLCSRNSASLSTHNDVTSCLMSLSADVTVLLSQFYFPPRLLHCTCSSLLAATPPSSSQRRPFLKRRNRGVSLASILEPLYLAANLAISSGYSLKNILQQQGTPFSTNFFPGSPLLTKNPRSFCFIAINSQRIVR